PPFPQPARMTVAVEHTEHDRFLLPYAALTMSATAGGSLLGAAGMEMLANAFHRAFPRLGAGRVGEKRLAAMENFRLLFFGQIVFAQQFGQVLLEPFGQPPTFIGRQG